MTCATRLPPASASQSYRPIASSHSDQNPLGLIMIMMKKMIKMILMVMMINDWFNNAILQPNIFFDNSIILNISIFDTYTTSPARLIILSLILTAQHKSADHLVPSNGVEIHHLGDCCTMPFSFLSSGLSLSLSLLLALTKTTLDTFDIWDNIDYKYDNWESEFISWQSFCPDNYNYDSGKYSFQNAARYYNFFRN